MTVLNNRLNLRWLGAELVVVVAGVLIAMSLGSIYEYRVDRRREKEYIRQLVADLRETEQLIGSRDSINAAWDIALASLMQSFRGGAEPPRDSVLVWIDQIQFDDPAPVLGTADAIIQTGDLQLIRDPAIRTAITSYVSRTRDYYMAGVLSMENEFLDARTLFRDRIDILELERPTILSQDRTSSLHDIGTRSPYPLVVSQLLGDRAAYSALARIVVAKSWLAEMRQGIRQDAKTLRENLQRETHGL